MGSQLGSLVESPLKALNGNQTGALQFWRVSARGGSPTPAFVKLRCAGRTGGLDDVINAFKYCTDHTWSFGGGDSQYEQTDTLDASTLEASTATANINTFPPGLFGDPPIWNDPFGYITDGSVTSSAGADWDPGSTRSAIIAALDAVDWSALWASSVSEPNNFQYDRVSIDPSQFGALPYGGTATGNLIANRVLIGPNVTLTGRVGNVSNFFSGGFSSANASGTTLDRSQIQIRNYSSPPVPYFIYERIPIAGGVDTSGALTETGDLARKVSEGMWDHDLQIIALPEATFGDPTTISTSFGARVRIGSSIGMVVGITWEDWMLSLYGPDWADHVFS
jgi:hypothetical protein